MKFAAIAVFGGDPNTMKLYGPFRSAMDATNFIDQTPPSLRRWFVRAMIEEDVPNEPKQEDRN